jgi:flagellar assembly protein FliH
VAAMTSSHRGIIRGADVDGIVFCDPSGGLVTKAVHERSEKDHLQALEEFWLSKGRQEGRQAGFDEGSQQGHASGLQEGESVGYQKGLSEGESKGLEKGLEDGRLEAEAQREEIVGTTRHDIIEFCMVVCKQVLRREMSDPEALKLTVGDLLDQAAGSLKITEMTVVLCPSDHTMLTSRFDEISAVFPDGIHWVSDSSIAQGDARVETSTGLVNFSIDRQIQELEQQVLETGEELDADTSEGNRDSQELAGNES